MEKNICSDFFSKENSKRFWKKLNGETSIQNGEICIYFVEKRFSFAISYFAKKWWKRFSTKVNGDFSILNGDFSILNGEKFLEHNLQIMFKKKLKTLLKNLNGEISIQNGEISIHFFLRSVLHQFFQKKKRFLLQK